MKIQPLEAEDQRKSEREHEVAQSCPTLRDPMDCSLPGSSVYGIFQARVLEWIAISFSKGSSQPRDRTQVSHIVDRCFTVRATREVQEMLFEWTVITWSKWHQHVHPCVCVSVQFGLLYEAFFFLMYFLLYILAFEVRNHVV